MFLLLLLLARPTQDVFLSPHIPWIEQGFSINIATLHYDLFNGLTDHYFLLTVLLEKARKEVGNGPDR